MLELSNISFGYEKGNPLYENVSLSIDRGERAALIAPSGYGKTTLCKIMAGYLLPWTGSITVDGSPLPKRGKLSVQMIFQHPEMAVDPRQRMAKTLEEAGELDEGLLDRFGIKDEWLTRFPHELSGGELQRFCIVRALMSDPSYLICDEISTMLDALTQAQIWHALIDEQEDRSMGIVLVSHSPALADCISTRKIVLA